MAGCDGRAKSRSYYQEFAEKLPKDTVILTAGCAKYKYNKLDLTTNWIVAARAVPQSSIISHCILHLLTL